MREGRSVRYQSFMGDRNFGVEGWEEKEEEEEEEGEGEERKVGHGAT